MSPLVCLVFLVVCSIAVDPDVRLFYFIFLHQLRYVRREKEVAEQQVDALTIENRRLTLEIETLKRRCSQLENDLQQVSLSCILGACCAHAAHLSFSFFFFANHSLLNADKKCRLPKANSRP